MFVENSEKAQLEHSNQVQLLKLEIAQLNSQIAKGKTSLSVKTPGAAAASASAAGELEDFDDDREIAKVTEQKFEQKVKELLKVQTDLEALQKATSEKDQEMRILEHRCEEMKDTMRQFTSLADKDDNDDMFEAVIRNEYELKEEQLLEKNQNLMNEIESLKDQLMR